MGLGGVGFVLSLEGKMRRNWGEFWFLVWKGLV